jgi:hypothetical protein
MHSGITRLMAPLVIAGLLSAGSISLANAAPADLAGNWSGSGKIVMPSGNSERARCRASFRKQGARGFTMTATCATASAKVQQTATLQRVSDSGFSGSFFNAEYGVSGSIAITARGKTLSVSLAGGGGSGSFSLTK